jgi:hypothetical protein
MNYEITLREEIYVDIAQLARTPPFAKYFAMQYIHYREEHHALIEGNETNNNTFYKKKDGKIKDFIDRVRVTHPVINNEELAIFKDALEDSYETVMRIAAGDASNQPFQIAKMQCELCRTGR